LGALEKAFDLLTAWPGEDFDSAGFIHPEKLDAVIAQRGGPVFIDGFVLGKRGGRSDDSADAEFLKKPSLGQNPGMVAADHGDIRTGWAEIFPCHGPGVGKKENRGAMAFEPRDDRFVVGFVFQQRGGRVEDLEGGAIRNGNHIS